MHGAAAICHHRQISVCAEKRVSIVLPAVFALLLLAFGVKDMAVAGQFNYGGHLAIT
jgi:hypothetical protein